MENYDISIETPIIHILPTDSAILQPCYCRQAGLSSLHHQSLEQPPLVPARLTSAPSLTNFQQCLKTSLFRRSYPNLIIWHSELTFCCGSSSNLVIHATLKISLMLSLHSPWSASELVIN